MLSCPNASARRFQVLDHLFFIPVTVGFTNDVVMDLKKTRPLLLNFYYYEIFMTRTVFLGSWLKSLL